MKDNATNEKFFFVYNLACKLSLSSVCTDSELIIVLLLTESLRFKSI